MIIKSIQIKDNSVSIDYQKPSATGLTDVFKLTSSDDPRPELLKAFSGLQQKFKFIMGRRAQDSLFKDDEE